MRSRTPSFCNQRETIVSDTFKQLFEHVVNEAAKQVIDAVNQIEPLSGAPTADSPPPPKAAADMIRWRSKLDELETSLSRFPHVMDALGSPASDATIKNANQALAPFRLPRWLEELYRWHNGYDHTLVNLFDLRFNSLEDSVRTYQAHDPYDYEFGWFRHFTFQFLGMDDDWMVAVLDQAGAVDEDTLLYWHYHDSPGPAYGSPSAWVDDLLLKLESVDEDSFDDNGFFLGWKNHTPIGEPVSIPYAFGGIRADQWPESYRQRAGITNYLITESALPPVDTRRLPADESLPHEGPWDVHFGGFGRQLFKSRRPRLPAQIRLGNLECILPPGVLSEYTLRYGFDLDAVVWFRAETLESGFPVIDRVRFPVK